MSTLYEYTVLIIFIIVYLHIAVIYTYFNLSFIVQQESYQQFDFIIYLVVLFALYSFKYLHSYTHDKHNYMLVYHGDPD